MITPLYRITITESTQVITVRFNGGLHTGINDNHNYLRYVVGDYNLLKAAHHASQVLGSTELALTIEELQAHSGGWY